MVLNMVLMRGNISSPQCLETPSSVDFLDGMTSLDTQCGGKEYGEYSTAYAIDIDDHEYMDRVARSLSTKTPIGARISSLALNIYCRVPCGMQGGIEPNSEAVFRLDRSVPESVVIESQPGSLFGVFAIVE